MSSWKSLGNTYIIDLIHHTMKNIFSLGLIIFIIGAALVQSIIPILIVTGIAGIVLIIPTDKRREHWNRSCIFERPVFVYDWKLRPNKYILYVMNLF